MAAVTLGDDMNVTAEGVAQDADVLKLLAELVSRIDELETTVTRMEMALIAAAGAVLGPVSRGDDAHRAASAGD